MEWKNVWSYTQQDYRSWPSQIENDRQVVRIRSNHYSKKLALRFSNEFGMEPLVFDSVTIRLLDQETLEPIEIKPVTVNDKQMITLLPTVHLLSDIIELNVNPGMMIEVETVVTKSTTLRSGTVSYSRREVEVYNFPLVDGQRVFKEQRDLFRMVKENNRMFFIYGISGIDLLVDDSAKTVVAFGDSLTQQGFWVDNFKGRLFDEGIHGYAVLNRGIGGSRVLKGQNPANDLYTRHGHAGIERFEREVYSFGNVDAVFCLHGINDLISRHDGSNEFLYSLDEIKAGINQYIAIAHHHGSSIFLGTVMPLGNAGYYSESVEKDRQAMNRWIRNHPSIEGVLDFDEAIKDPKEPHKIEKIYECGDGLHVSDQGGKQMAAVVKLEQLTNMLLTKGKN